MSGLEILNTQKNIEIIKDEIQKHYSYNSDNKDFKDFWLMNLDLREFDSYDYKDLLSQISKKINYNDEEDIPENFKRYVLDVFIKKEIVKILNEHVDSILDLYIDNVVKNEYGRISPEKINSYILKYYGVERFFDKIESAVINNSAKTEFIANSFNEMMLGTSDQEQTISFFNKLVKYAKDNDINITEYMKNQNLNYVYHLKKSNIKFLQDFIENNILDINFCNRKGSNISSTIGDRDLEKSDWDWFKEKGLHFNNFMDVVHSKNKDYIMYFMDNFEYDLLAKDKTGKGISDVLNNRAITRGNLMHKKINGDEIHSSIIAYHEKKLINDSIKTEQVEPKIKKRI